MNTKILLKLRKRGFYPPPPLISWGTVVYVILLIFPAMLYSQSGEKYSVNGNYLGVPDILGSKNYAPLNFATNSTICALFTADGNFEAWYDSYFKKNVTVDSTITAWEIYAMYRLSVYGDVVVTGIMKSASLILTDGNITSSTGTVVFGSNNLSTTGNVTAGSFNSPSFAGNSRAMLATDTAGNIIRKGYSGNPNDVLTGDGNWSNLTQSTGWQWVDSNLVSTAEQVVVANNLAVGGKISVGQMKVISNGSNKDTLHTEKELVIITDSKNISLDADTVKIPRLLDSKRMETDTLNSKKINASKIYVAGDITSTGTVYTGNLYVANDVMLPLFAGTKNLLLTDSTGKVSPLGISSTSNKVLLSNGTWGAVPIPQNYWQMQGDDIYTLTPGNIGLGMNNPVYKLDVAGTVRISEDLLVGGGIIISEKVNATRELKSASLRADSIFMDNTKAFYGESRFADSVKIQSKLRVDGNIDVGGDLRSSGSLIFGSNKNISYFPHQNGITGDFCFGTPIPTYTTCNPVTETNQNWFGGTVNMWGNPSWNPLTPSSVLKIGSDGSNGIIEIEGTNAGGGEAGLLINYYCGRNVVVGGRGLDDPSHPGPETGTFTTRYDTYLAVSNGKVGIGTTSPDSKLEVAGEIHSTGNIINGGPDFILGLNDGRANPSGRHRALVHDGWNFELDELTINYDGDFLDGVHVMGKKTYFDGTVGIGLLPDANSPKLNVNGNVRIADLTPPTGNFNVVVADEDGLLGTKDKSEIGDNLGNHTATNDIILGDNWLSRETNVQGQPKRGMHIDQNGDFTFLVEGNNSFDIKGNSRIPLRRGISLNEDIGGGTGGEFNFWLSLWQDASFNFKGYAPPDDQGNPSVTKDFMTILKNGNVGIGTTNPEKILHIKNENAPIIRLHHTPSDKDIEHPQYIWDIENNTGNLSFKYAYSLSNELPVTNTSIILTSDGKVGIGTTPLFYKLEVDGTIKACEVRVNLTGCDFVFDKNYPLFSMKQRKQKVLTQGHLLNIESAKDKIEFSLNNLTRGLWQNVEEHELYLYDHDERIEKLEQTIELLINENKEKNIQIEILKKEIQNLKK